MTLKPITDLALGKLLQISFSSGVFDQLSTEHAEFQMVQQMKVASNPVRQHQYMVQTGRGPAGVQFANPGDNTQPFPKPQASKIQEGIATFKEINATVEVDANLLERARQSIDKYGEPLMLEMDGKQVEVKRLIAKMLHGDGTGVVCTSAGAPVETKSGANITSILLTIRDNTGDRGGIGNLAYDDLLVVKTSDGSTDRAPTETAGTQFYAWKVSDFSRAGLGASTVTLIPVDSSGVAVPDITACNIVAGDVLYRNPSSSAVFPTFASISDYGTASEVFPGLESLLANDGRVVNGLTMSGAFSGTRKSGGAGTLDITMLHSLMDNVKVRVGQSAYSWRKAICSPEAAAVLVEARSTDRRFNAATDTDSGVTKFTYSHYKDGIELIISEFCKLNRVWVIPEGKNGKKVLEARITPIGPIKADGQLFRMTPTEAGFYRRLQAHLMGHLSVYATHPAACGVLENFIIS
jgi:hypothetical protein